MRKKTVARIAKWLFFVAYALFMRAQWMFGSKNAPASAFTWKHAWFFLWHHFCWGAGRWLLGHIVRIRPLACELSPDAAGHYQRFSELAARDFSTLKLEERFLRPTRYRLAKDTVEELCLLYAALAACAPWQYGTAARILARKKSRNICLTACALFCISLFYGDTASAFSTRLSFFSFIAMCISSGGWYASACICRIAIAAERLGAYNKPERR